MESKFTYSDILAAKQKKRRIVAVSCYDYTTAQLVSQTDVQMIVVGDSAAQFMLGFDSTLPAKMDFMVAITAAVRRGAPNVYLVADMPFLSYQIGKSEAVKNAGRFVVEAGVQMVKIEAGGTYLDVIKAVSDAGMAVMAHIGIRPQTISKTGQLKAEATTAEMALEMIALADQMVVAGASMLLLEGVAAEVSEIISERCELPVIGCGSGPGCDGQVLIAPDVLGLTQGKYPKFSKCYGNLAKETVEALNKYCQDVTSSHFPNADHSYHLKSGELDKLKNMLAN